MGRWIIRLGLAGLPAGSIPPSLLDPASWLAVDAAGQPVTLDLRSDQVTPARPGRLALSSPVPNPFNPRTEVELSLPRGGRAEVTIFDLAGRPVRGSSA